MRSSNGSANNTGTRRIIATRIPSVRADRQRDFPTTENRRDFGGVLLGAGGLVRAYAKTAAESIRAAGRVDMRCCAAYEATVPYPLWGRVESILRTEALLENTAYAESIEVRLSVPLDREAALLKQLSDRTDGRVLPVKTGIVQRAFDAGLPELKE